MSSHKTIAASYETDDMNPHSTSPRGVDRCLIFTQAKVVAARIRSVCYPTISSSSFRLLLCLTLYDLLLERSSGLYPSPSIPFSSFSHLAFVRNLISSGGVAGDSLKRMFNPQGTPSWCSQSKKFIFIKDEGEVSHNESKLEHCTRRICRQTSILLIEFLENFFLFSFLFCFAFYLLL